MGTMGIMFLAFVLSILAVVCGIVAFFANQRIERFGERRAGHATGGVLATVSTYALSLVFCGIFCLSAIIVIAYFLAYQA